MATTKRTRSQTAHLTFRDLIVHDQHEVEIVRYSEQTLEGLAAVTRSVSLECLDCGMVIASIEAQPNPAKEEWRARSAIRKFVRRE